MLHIGTFHHRVIETGAGRDDRLGDTVQRVAEFNLEKTMTFQDRLRPHSPDPLLRSPQQRPQDRARRRPRHSGIFEAMRALDAQVDEATRHEIAKWIGEQYAAEYGSILLGLVARCYLGPPFVDHRLDLLGSIVEHYAPSDAMPFPYDGARMMARAGSYAFVEVHSDGSYVPVADDGSVS